MLRTLKIQILWLALILGVTSCVGTYETVENEVTNYTNPSTNTFEYPGLITATAIANDKIQIDFSPTEDTTDYNYYLHINGATEGTIIDLDTITLLYDGSYRYILQDLAINTTYTIKVSATQLSTGYKSTGERSLQVKTFDNKVADFLGISSVEPVTGSPATAVRVRWNEATFNGSVVAGSFDPVYYQVYYISLDEGYENLFDSSQATVITLPSSGTITPSNHSDNTELIIEALSPEKTYFFGVRAVHKIYAQNSTNSSLDKEINETYIWHTMDSSSDDADFEKSSFEVENALSGDAFDTVQTFWSPGDGNFSHYRLFLRKYPTGSSNFESEDTLSKSTLLGLEEGTTTITCSTITEGSSSDVQEFTVSSSGTIADSSLYDCFDVPATMTSLNLAGLTAYSQYQLKIALCQNEDCPLSATSTSPGILSDLARIVTKPTLAPFSGVSAINNPTDINAIDEVILSLNQVVIQNGYADTLEVYCVDPDDHTSYVKFPQDGTAITDTSVPACTGLVATLPTGAALSTLITLDQVGAVDSLTLSNLTVDGSQKYCIAAGPSITKRTDAPIDVYNYVSNDGGTYGELRSDFGDLLIECATPEAITPTAEEFEGLTLGSCDISDNSLTVSWTTPTSGLYNGYRVFYKAKDSDSFRFLSAIADTTNAVYSSEDAASGDSSLTINNLKAGETYQLGVLSSLSYDSNLLYSESNSNTLECTIPFPTATFDEWTRVLAVGPKMDGRIPKVSPDGTSWPDYQISSENYQPRISEAVRENGLIYEVEESSDVVFDPPGEAISGQYFNGHPSSGSPVSMASRDGIVSLAWKEVSLNYSQSYFEGQTNCTDTSTYSDCDHIQSRNSRLYGYRVYRSLNYGVTWENLTLTADGSEEALVHSVDFTYRTSPNRSDITERMGFFTDYSVQYITPDDQIDRARVYLYKIVPIYDGAELSFADKTSSMPKNVIKVTLPPPNMALVHRKMANRSNCMTINRYDEIDKDNNYRCTWNGVGVDAETLPLRVGSTVIDQGADLLVDRFELGCNYTRGDPNLDYKAGKSWFKKATKTNSWNGVSSFTGFSTDSAVTNSNANDTSTYFRGCVTQNTINNFRNTGSNVNTDPSGADLYGTAVEYQETIFGDCMGNDVLSIPMNYSSSSNFVITRDFTFPGANTSSQYWDNPSGTTAAERWDISSTLVSKPQYAYGDDTEAATQFLFTPEDAITGSRSTFGLLDRDIRLNILAQSEFAAVYYNQTTTRAYTNVPYYGPGETQINKSGTAWSRTENCFINLPTIDSTETDSEKQVWRPRWLSSRDLGRMKETSSDTEYEGEILTHTLQEVLDNSLYYNSTDYASPDSTSYNTERINTSMPIGRIISSNAAKLPVLKGLTAEHANEVCSTYKVQTGYADADGNFTPNNKAVSKHLPTRKEQLTSSSYPKMLSNSEIQTIEFSSSSSVSGCKTYYYPNTSHPYTLQAGDFLSSDYANSTGVRVPFMTGTGRLDPKQADFINYTDAATEASTRNPWSTEDCQSEFGIQDLVGNTAELSSNELYCDYSEDSQALYFGLVQSGSGNITHSVRLTIEDGGSGANFIYYNKDTEVCKAINSGDDATLNADGTYWVDSGETYTYGATTYELWCLNSSSYSVKPWKYSNVDSGYCSFLDSNRNRVSDTSNYLDSNNYFFDVYNPDGSVNTDLIYAENENYQEGVRAMANGDGRYLNFGPANLASTMSFNYSQSFSLWPADGDDATKDTLYFSPLIGFPLSCLTYTGSSGDESCNSSSSDNMNFTLQNYWDNFPDSDPGSSMLDNNFYIGSSYSNNVGIEETVGSDSVQSINFGGSNDPLSGQYSVVWRLIEVPGVDDTIYEYYQSNDTTAFPSEDNRDIYQYYFDVERGARLSVVTGGDTTEDQGAGRYSLDIIEQETGVNSGFRCVARVNEEE